MHNSLVHHITCVFAEGVVDLVANAAGTYTLDAQPQVEPALFGFQDNHRVTSIVAAGVGNTELTGLVYIEEGCNCRVAVDPDTDRVRITAARGAGAGRCSDEYTPTLACDEVLLRINGLQAGDQGGFMLVGSDGVEVEPDPDNHRVIIRAKVDSEEIVCPECE